jgi:radical SAM enzyme (TIGR01210 family)
VVEDERAADGTIEPVVTIFLTGRECPLKCVMCDLWKHTTRVDTPVGAIPDQILRAFDERASRQPTAGRPHTVKLYNAGSFFDPRAVPVQDYDAIAMATHDVDRLIVECHPALVGPRIDRFLEARTMHSSRSRAKPPALEVAMGLETAHPDALDSLHKRFSLDDFKGAAETLATKGVELRVFLLIYPPFVPAAEQDVWLQRSVAIAADSGATAISLIPTRAGNGAMEALGAGGLFTPPTLADVERSMACALAEGNRYGARVFVDLRNMSNLSACPHCRQARIARLHQINLHQVIAPRVQCCEQHES